MSHSSFEIVVFARNGYLLIFHILVRITQKQLKKILNLVISHIRTLQGMSDLQFFQVMKAFFYGFNLNFSVWSTDFHLIFL